MTVYHFHTGVDRQAGRVIGIEKELLYNKKTVTISTLELAARLTGLLELRLSYALQQKTAYQFRTGVDRQAGRVIGIEIELYSGTLIKKENKFFPHI